MERGVMSATPTLGDDEGDACLQRTGSGVEGLPTWTTRPRVSTGDGKSDSRYSGMPEHILSSINQSPCRQTVTNILFSSSFKGFITLAIGSTLVFIWIETDRRADGSVPDWVNFSNWILLFIYSVEITMRIYMEQRFFFSSYWNCFDLTLVVTDLGVLMITPFLPTQGSLTFIRIFRVIRAFRVARVLRLVLIFRELYMIVHGMISIGKALVWASGLMLLVLSMCSIISVELLHPLMEELVEEGAFDSCPRCARSFDSIWNANLLWIQSLVAGDSWGSTALPVIDAYPWAAIIFLSTLVITQLGLLNLIMTVMLDTALQGRSNDQERILAEKDREMAMAFQRLSDICSQLDEDKSGELSLQEMLKGYKTHKGFRSGLRLMDINSDDLATVFELMDQDESGRVSYLEFIQQLHKMRTSDSHTMLVFIKHHVTKLQSTLSKIIWEIRKESKQDIASLNADLNEQRHVLAGLAKRQKSLLPKIYAEVCAADDDELDHFSCITEDLDGHLQGDAEASVEVAAGNPDGGSADCDSSSFQMEASQNARVSWESNSLPQEPPPAGGEATSMPKLVKGASRVSWHPSVCESTDCEPSSQPRETPSSLPKEAPSADAESNSLPKEAPRKSWRASRKSWRASRFDAAALPSSIQAELHWHTEKMMQLLQQEQLTKTESQPTAATDEVNKQVDKQESKDTSEDKRDCKLEDTSSSEKQNARGSMRMLTAELDAMESSIATDLESRCENQVQVVMDSISKDFDADLNRLRQHAQNMMSVLREGSKSLDNKTDLRNTASRESSEHMPLAVQPGSNRRMPSVRETSAWGAQCCAPPRPLVRGILS